jgi:hypothetical protein
MKITDEVLEALNAKLVDKENRIWHLNVYFQLRWDRQNEIPKGNFWDVWELGGHDCEPFHGHFVDSVEEIFKFAYKDGYQDGRNSLREDLKELLNDKDH